MSEAAMWGPAFRWHVGSYEFTRYRREHYRGRGLWGCVRHGRGVEGARTPVGAFLALRRWQRQPVTPA